MITININYYRRPFGVEQEFFIQLFFEIDPNNTEVPKTDKLLTQMFHEQLISFTRVRLHSWSIDSLPLLP